MFVVANFEESCGMVGLRKMPRVIRKSQLLLLQTVIGLDTLRKK